MQSANLFKLAIKIQPLVNRFYLAGGTAIMLKHQHRQSIDLDFFAFQSFSFRHLSQKIRQHFDISEEREFIDNIDFFIKDIKVSFVYFPFTNILPLEKWRGVRMASDYDLFLNKIYACSRRIDSKDPKDIAFLFEKYQWNSKNFKKDYEKKFPQQSYEIALGAVLNIDDYPDLDNKAKDQLKKLYIQQSHNMHYS